MTVRFTRKSDGSCVLRCERADGTSTWQRREGEFFALHDLTHYAVETVLDLTWGFYGLVADGWNITDFGHPWPRGPIPHHAMPDAMLAEWLAGLLDQERGTGHRLSAQEMAEALHSMARTAGRDAAGDLGQTELERIRERFQELAFQWRMLPDGESMTLTYARDPAR